MIPISKEDILSKKDGYYSQGYDGSVTPIYEAMDEWADIKSRERATGFFSWYATSLISIIQEVKEVGLHNIPDELNKRIEEREGKSIQQLYQSHLQTLTP